MHERGCNLMMVSQARACMHQGAVQLRIVLSHAMQIPNCQSPARAIDTHK